MIAAEAGMCVRTARRHLAELVRRGLVARRPDPKHIGGPWVTCILDAAWVENGSRKREHVVYKPGDHGECTNTQSPGHEWPHPWPVLAIPVATAGHPFEDLYTRPINDDVVVPPSLLNLSFRY